MIGQIVPLLAIKKPHSLIRGRGDPGHSRKKTWMLSLSGFRQGSG